jgi:S1-C subfamily serine protease
LIRILTLFVVLSFQNALWQAAPSQVRDARPSVYSFVVNGETICTGFVVKETDTRLMTAGHCAENLKTEDLVYAYSSETGTRYPVKLSRYTLKWPTEDFAIFTFPGDKPESGLTTTRTLPELGDDVWTIEGPKGIAPVLSRGIYSGRVRMADEPQSEVNGMYMINLPSGPGASGSPVFDKQGRVWGILVGGDRSLPGFALVVLITS